MSRIKPSKENLRKAQKINLELMAVIKRHIMPEVIDGEPIEATAAIMAAMMMTSRMIAACEPEKIEDLLDELVEMVCFYFQEHAERYQNAVAVGGEELWKEMVAEWRKEARGKSD